MSRLRLRPIGASSTNPPVIRMSHRIAGYFLFERERKQKVLSEEGGGLLPADSPSQCPRVETPCEASRRIFEVLVLLSSVFSMHLSHPLLLE